MDLNTALANAKRPERTVPICLRGDLQAQFEDLERALAVAKAKDNDSLAGSAEVRSIAEQIQALEQEMLDATVVLRVRGRTNPEWVQIVTDHEPREDSAEDRAMGYNVATFFPDLVGGYTDSDGEHVEGCLVDVTGEQWARLYSIMSAGQFDQLSNAALAVSRRQVDLPKSRAASAALRSSDATPSLPGS